MKTTPEAGLDTASPHAVSQDGSPRSRRFVVLGGTAFAVGVIGVVGWQLSRPHDRAQDHGGAAQTAAASTPSVVSAIATETAAPIPAPSAVTVTAASSASSDLVLAHKTAPIHPGVVAKPAAKPDAATRPPEFDPAKAAPPKRPGGLIEDVPF